MSFQPIFDRILVRRVEKDKVSEGGIVLPSDITKEQPTIGTVVAVGGGKVLDSGVAKIPEVQVGDEILFGKYSGMDVKVDGETLLVIHECDIIGIFKKD
jgi:chaperonin GroES